VGTIRKELNSPLTMAIYNNYVYLLISYFYSTLLHTNIPDGQGESYKKCWKDFYFTPMKKYFKKSAK